MRDDGQKRTKEIPNGLTFSQAQVNFILGHALRSLYQDVLDTPVPEHLAVLLLQLETAQPREE